MKLQDFMEKQMQDPEFAKEYNDLETEFKKKEKQMENRINSLLANNIQKEEQEKIISYCFEFSDKESQILADIFELYEV